MRILDAINAVLWHDTVLFVVLGTGVLFTLWSGFGQYRSLTHGVKVLTGAYDRPGDPGAITHFQALSAALSATVGLGNVAGVALAVSLGGPGAIFWMWMTGLFGMALKMVEVTQAMLYRKLDDLGDPHGGAMWVVSRGLARHGGGWERFGHVMGALFCVTVLISTVTGGNLFQAWNVLDISHEYLRLPPALTASVLTVLVALVILGGIRRIGAVAGRLVPLMCGLYLLAGLGMVATHLAEVPEMLRLIVHSAFNPSEAQGAFVGGTAGWAFLKGMQRALFSNEAGQGSAPIAHAAARTDEPVREGIVAGIEPFVDTLCVCTLTAMVILLSGVWNRAPEAPFSDRMPAVVEGPAGSWSLEPTALPRGDGQTWRPGAQVFTVMAVPGEDGGETRRRLAGTVREDGTGARVEWSALAAAAAPRLAAEGTYAEYKGATLTAKAFDQLLPGLGLWLVPAVAWLFAFSTIISWSYYGEQAVVYLWGRRFVRGYRLLYCLCVPCAVLIRSEAQIDAVSTLGTGVMLVVNIPIMLLFGAEAMRSYRDYVRRLRAGEFVTSER